MNTIPNYPLVSIVIPVYNVELYLKDCLNSVINQSLKEIEIICVNDASTDKSLEIIVEYSAKDQRIIVIDQKVNGGLSVARNIGAMAARGEYLYFLDSDDMVKLDAMEELYKKAKKEALDVLCFEGDTFFESGDLEKKYDWSKKWCIRSREYSEVKTGLQMMSEMYPNNDYKAVVWILFINRDFYVRENLEFVPGLIYEDNIFTFECMFKAKRVSHIWKKYYLRRVRENSLTTANKFDIRYPYGFFYAGLSMMRIVGKSKLDQAEQLTIGQEISQKFSVAQNLLNKLEPSEIERYKEFSKYEMVLFEQFVLKPWRMNKQKIKLRNSMRLALNDTKKITEVLEEKEIKLNSVQRELRKKNNELAHIKNGISFRIGRIITWLPRILFGRK